MILRTGRLVLRPVGWADLPDLTALKADPRAFAQMLGGVRTPVRTAEELAEDIAFWGARGVGMFALRFGVQFVGIAGVHERPDGRGVGLRFALWPEARGRGLAAEAAGAALRFTLERGVERVVAVAREDNVGSRQVLGGIGMVAVSSFLRAGNRVLVYEALAARFGVVWVGLDDR